MLGHERCSSAVTPTDRPSGPARGLFELYTPEQSRARGSEPVTVAGPLPDELTIESSRCFHRMVESVGVKRFSSCMDLSTRQINRMLSGAQPNPVERLVRSMQSCQPDVGDEALSFVCQEAGGLFIKDEAAEPDVAAARAVRECAEAIAAISDGEISRVDEQEVREAITALTGLLHSVREHREHEAAPVVESKLSLNGVPEAMSP